MIDPGAQDATMEHAIGDRLNRVLDEHVDAAAYRVTHRRYAALGGIEAGLEGEPGRVRPYPQGTVAGPAHRSTIVIAKPKLNVVAGDDVNGARRDRLAHAVDDSNGIVGAGWPGGGESLLKR